MKENNSETGNGRNCPSPVFEPSEVFKYYLEYIQGNKLDFLSLLLEVQKLMLRNTVESDYSGEEMDKITACLDAFQHIVIEA